MGNSLEGKVAVVTGSGMGVCRGVAIGLAREGARVVTNSLRDKDDTVSFRDKSLASQLSEDDLELIRQLSGDAATTADLIVEEGGEAVPVFGDVSDMDVARQIVGAALDNWGRVDILVNGAAVGGIQGTLSLTESDWDLQINSKLKGSFNLIHNALPIMVRQKFGRIINVSSDAWIGIPGFLPYCAASAGLVGMTKSLAREMWGQGITVNAICPRALSRMHVNARALVRSMRAAGAREDKPGGQESRFDREEQEHGPAENLAPFFAYLGSESAGHISGSVFTVASGGRIALYGEFELVTEINKTGAPWTVEELVATAPEQLLKGYVSTAAGGSSVENRTLGATERK